MATIITLLAVLACGAAWALSPDKHRDGTNVTGVYDFPRDSLHARHTPLDTQAVTRGAR